MNALDILCATTPGHSLRAVSTDSGVIIHTLALGNTDDSGVDPHSVPVLLLPERARELFNWLGVYLHTEAGE